MLMAAGLGTRLQPFTDAEPKALLPLLGVPMAQFAVDALRAADVMDIVANIHHLPDRARAGLGALDKAGARITISDESEELLGSAGGIRRALPHLGGGAFFLLNADVLCDSDLASLARRHARLRSRHGVELTLTVFPSGPSGESYREILFDPASGLVTGLGNKVTGRPFWTGSAVLEPGALADVPPTGPSEFVPKILEPLIRKKRVGVHLASGWWHDVGSPLLWWRTHLGLLRLLETSRPPRWSSRIEAVNRRLAPGIWIGRDSPIRVPAAEWGAPAYWSAWGDETARVPREFGPCTVVYGAMPGTDVSGGGIGFQGKWVSGFQGQKA